MESLFRFVNVRPPSIKEPPEDQAQVSGDNEVAAAAEKVLTADTPDEQKKSEQDLDKAIREIPDEHKLSSSNPSQLAASLHELGQRWLRKPDRITTVTVTQSVERSIGKTIDRLHADEALKSLQREVSLRILAARLGSKGDARWLPRLTILSQVIAVLQRVEKGPLENEGPDEDLYHR